MLRSAAALLVLSALVSACGGEARNAAPAQAEQAASDTAATAAPTPTTEAVETPGEATRAHLLSSSERNRLRSIATSVGAAIDLFDATVVACPNAGRDGCFDRAWSVLYWNMDWPPYYLRRFGARTRGCDALAVAVKGVSSFNLAARQLDYGDPAEVGTATGRRDRLALVDMLRPSPSELRTAADSACR
jgi:hypothetical protein